jgi:2-iminobutanoate/2-iminopropanoate deaminase
MSNRITIDPGWDHHKKLTFAPAVRKGNMLFISGTDASHVDQDSGKVIVHGDIGEQTEVIFKKFREVLEAAGASFDDIVQTTDYITTTEGYKATADIRRRYFGDTFPAATGVIVKSLLHKTALIEIDAVAVLD